MKFKTLKPGMQLQGKWTATVKLDGVRAIYKNGVPLSRAGKPLYNLPSMPDGHYEVFKDTWETSVSMVRTKQGEPVMPYHIIQLYPIPDPSLTEQIYNSPTYEDVEECLTSVLNKGYEGLVLHQQDNPVRYKVKPIETYDVEVAHIIPGKGKHAGRMGALVTDMGIVGTGFTDKDREFTDWLGMLIEVEAMGLTPNGKFRHPRFKRIRWDK